MPETTLWASLENPPDMRWSVRINSERERVSGMLRWLTRYMSVEDPDGLDVWLRRLDELQSWADRNNLRLGVLESNTVRMLNMSNATSQDINFFVDVTFPVKFEVIPVGYLGRTGRYTTSVNEHVIVGSRSSCCGSAMSYMSGYHGIRCHSCERSCVCQNCTIVGVGMLGDNLCPTCRSVPRPWYCYGCDDSFTDEAHTLDSGEAFCSTCYEHTRCNTCLRTSRTYWQESVCEYCEEAAEVDFPSNLITLPADELPVEGQIPSLPERPFRTITIETEVNGNSRRLGRALYACGMIARPQMHNYSHVSDSNDEFPAIFKSDSSVTGGEILLPFLELDHQEHVDTMYALMQVLKTLEQSEDISIDTHCGGHIHMDAKGMSHHDVWRLTILYGYLENTLYHLAGAGQSGGHRSINDSEAYEDEDGYWHDGDYTDYARPTLKGPFGTLTNFGRLLRGADRSAGLNLSNYFRALENCGCGAMQMGSPNECTCTLNKYTIEWRLWGATLNPRIIHAWVALMQAITAVAQAETNMTETEEGRFPPFAWDKTHFPRIPKTAQVPSHPLLRVTEDPFVTATKERLVWMHTKLPLTNAERDSLVYTCKNSELKSLGVSYLDSLLTLRNESKLMPKKTRNNRRVRNIRRANGPQLPLGPEPVTLFTDPPPIPDEGWVRMPQTAADAHHYATVESPVINFTEITQGHRQHTHYRSIPDEGTN